MPAGSSTAGTAAISGRARCTMKEAVGMAAGRQQPGGTAGRPGA